MPITLKSLHLTIPHLSLITPEAICTYYTTNADFLSKTSAKLPDNFLTPEYWQTRILTSKDELNPLAAIRFVITYTDYPSHIIGVINLTQIFRGSFQACYLGFSLCKDFEGQGLMTEALQSVINYAFQTVNLHRIMANHLPENTRSAAVLKKLGFVTEGLAKQYLFINGEWRDHVLTSLTQGEYQFK